MAARANRGDEGFAIGHGPVSIGGTALWRPAISPRRQKGAARSTEVPIRAPFVPQSMPRRRSERSFGLKLVVCDYDERARRRPSCLLDVGGITLTRPSKYSVAALLAICLAVPLHA